MHTYTVPTHHVHSFNTHIPHLLKSFISSTCNRTHITHTTLTIPIPYMQGTHTAHIPACYIFFAHYAIYHITYHIPHIHTKYNFLQISKQPTYNTNNVTYKTHAKHSICTNQ